MIRAIKVCLTLISIIAIVSGCASQTTITTSKVEANTKYSSEELKEDLSFLFNTFERVHPNLYCIVSKNTIDSILKEIAVNELNRSLTAIEFWRIVAPVVALLGDGHTTFQLPWLLRKKYLDDGGLIIPFEIFIDGDNLKVKTNYTNDTTLSFNSKIISINKIPANEIINTMVKYQSGEKVAFRKTVVSKTFKPLLWAIYDFRGDFNVEYISNMDNAPYQKVFIGITSKEFDEITKRNLSKKEGFANSFHSLTNEKIGIMNLKTFGGSQKHFEEYYKNTFTQIKKDSITDLIIDIRENGGGSSGNGDLLFNYITDKPYMQIAKADYKVSDELRQKIKKNIKETSIILYYILHPLIYIHPDGRKIFSSKKGSIASYELKPFKPRNNSLLFKGNVYLLTSEYTFSAAVDFASAFKCYRMGTIIGEETGGLTSCFIDLFHFKLPNTNMSAGVSVKKNTNACGKDDGHGVLPDHHVEPSMNDLEKGVDTAMEYTKDIIRKKRHENIIR